MFGALIVGLGGTGSWALAHLKNRLRADGHWSKLAGGAAVMTRPDYDRIPYPVELKALDVDQKRRPVVGELRLDQSVEDIALAAPIGKAIEDIREAEGGSAYPTIEAWLSAEEASQYDLTDAIRFMTEGAGQIRQFGRIAFFHDAITNAQELGKLHAAFTSLQRGATAETSIQIFVVASVAGGTGAGLLIDTLAYLHAMRQNLPGEISVRTTGFIMLPNAFSGLVGSSDTFGTDAFERMQANGMGTLRELDRLLNAYETVELEWRPGQRVDLKAPVLDACYLVDGSRDLQAGAPNLDSHKPVENGLPAAIADAIYTHINPASGAALGRDYPNLVDRLIGGDPHRYSSFGSYTITYAWEPLIRSLGLRALDNLLGAILQDGAEAGRGYVAQFLSAGATGSLSAGDKQQSVPAIATEALTGGLDPLTLVVPGTAWVTPRENPAVVPAPPNLLDRFPGIGKLRTEYTNPQVVAEAEELIDAFWGARNATWDRQSEPSFHAAVNYNAAATEREWHRALMVAATAIMDANRRIGGLSAAYEFLLSTEVRLQQFGDALAKIGRPDLTPFRNAVNAAQEEMNDGRSWDDAKEQRDYLQAQQELLAQQVVDESIDQTSKLVGRLSFATSEVKDVVIGWRKTLDELQHRAAAERIRVDDDRRTANEAPLQRYVPLPGDTVENQLFREIYGAGDETTLPAGLASILDAVSWSLFEAPELPTEIVFKHPGFSESQRPTEITLGKLETVSVAPFVELRDRSVLEILELANEDPGAVADELRIQGARLAAYDVSGQLRQTGGEVQPPDWNYFFADWPAEGPGSEFANQMRAGAEGHGIALENLGELRQADQLPSRDKLISFSARHLIALDAFRGVRVLENAYTRRRDHFPSPHVLPEERGAALLEALSESLARDGLIPAPLNRLTPDAVALCADRDFLQYVAACAAAGRLTFEMTDPVKEIGSWTVSNGAGPHEIGTEADLAATLASILRGDDHAAKGARDALEGAGSEAARAEGARDRLMAYAREGWQHGGNVPPATDQILRVAAAELATRL